MTLFLDHNKYYRLPWNLPDNAISWLEVTKACNMYCEGCYRENDPKGHKPLDEIKHDLEIFKRFRKTDGISLAGGDPLVHPNIVEIVRLVARNGLKPIINTNGFALNRELLQELKKAGAAGFTFHVDSKQHRPHWKGKTEIELNQLRLYFAEMLAEAGELSCAFNSTIYGDTLPSVADIVEWGQKHIDIVHVLVFIAFRAAVIAKHFDLHSLYSGESVSFANNHGDDRDEGSLDPINLLKEGKFTKLTAVQSYSHSILSFAQFLSH